MPGFYDPLYRFVAATRIPKAWVFGSGDSMLGQLLEARQLHRGRAIDLGCGVGSEAIFLARQGFEVTGLDLSQTAIRVARGKALDAGIEVDFRVADLTRPLSLDGTFDLVVDLGTLNDIPADGRPGYVENVVSLTHPGSLYVLFGFRRNLPPNERTARFGRFFTIETIEDRVEPLFRRRMITSLLTRNDTAAP